MSSKHPVQTIPRKAVRRVPNPLQAPLLHTKELPSGANCYIIPKKGYASVQCMVCVRYGAMDMAFTANGRRRDTPAGAAHFLEHKLFESAAGQPSVFEIFARQGADVNAFTTAACTAYYFTAASYIQENLRVLLDFVYNLHLTDENVEKEKGIITQEIRMYDDDPQWAAHFGLLETAYAVNPSRMNIAGTAESVELLTKEILEDCYNVFYRPHNMAIVCAGDFESYGLDDEALYDLIDKSIPRNCGLWTGSNERHFGAPPTRTHGRAAERFVLCDQPGTHGRAAERFVLCDQPRPFMQDSGARVQAQGKGVEVVRHYGDEPTTVSREFICKQMSVSRPIFNIGIKDDLAQRQKPKDIAATKLLLDMLCGESSVLYNGLFAKGLIGESFGADYLTDASVGLSVFAGESAEPQRVYEAILAEIVRMQAQGINHADFDRLKRKHIGQFIQGLNSLEAIAAAQCAYFVKQTDLPRMLYAYQALTAEDISARLADFGGEGQTALSVVEGK